MENNLFKKILNDKFNFLEIDYGFEKVGCNDSSECYEIIFQNATTGVSICYDYRDANIFVYLHKLFNGKIVNDKTPISEKTPLNSIELSYIVKHRNEKNLTKPLYDVSITNFESLVSQISNNLINYANDILKGNFNVFLEVDFNAKKRRLDWQKVK